MDRWVLLISYALIDRTMKPPFRGIPPRPLSPRAFARSRGFQNATHMARVAAQRQQELQQLVP